VSTGVLEAVGREVASLVVAAVRPPVALGRRTPCLIEVPHQAAIPAAMRETLVQMQLCRQGALPVRRHEHTEIVAPFAEEKIWRSHLLPIARNRLEQPSTARP
jgi:hypothetical protein